MPSSSRSRTKLEGLIVAILMATAGGLTFWLWKGQNSLSGAWLQRLPGSFEAARTSLQRRVVGGNSGNSLATSQGSQRSAPLIVPPPVIPQALPPQQAWPEPPLVQNQPGFTDVSSDYWAGPVLADLVDRQLMTGFPDGSFRPAEPMTRAEFAAQLARLFDLPPRQEAVVYQDVALDHWAYRAIQKSVQMKFLSGYPEGNFLPEQGVTRIHVVVALANGLSLRSSSGTHTVLKQYVDYAQVLPWGERPLVAATEAGLVVNYPDLNYLEPNRLASRAEVMTMLHRALVYMGRLQDRPLPYVVVPQSTPN